VSLVLHLLLVSLEVALAVPMLYLILLSMAALVQRPQRQHNPATPLTRFALLVPAHNEEAVIGDLLASLREQTHPAALTDVHVVADNCSDATASLAREAGACVYERQDQVEQGKGYALRWLLAQLEAAGLQYDAYVFIDADSTLSPNFLSAMDARLQAGAQVLQSQYRVQNSQEAWTAGLRAVAFALFNHVRPLGRKTLGWSCGLKGTGMCFRQSIIKQFGWNKFSLTEDMDYHTDLISAGLRVAYVPEAILWSTMPTTLKQARSQQMRWEQGRLFLVRRHVPRLLWSALCTRNSSLLDAALEILTPPLSALAGLVVLSAIGALLLASPLDLDLAVFLVAGLCAHVLVGLRLARLSRAAYRSLLFAPVFILWKFWVYLVALLPSGERRWVRTPR
jgi:1,2-diacylglycerol 3-beta-glucosyltransferase